jgi:hypothetical protein
VYDKGGGAQGVCVRTARRSFGSGDTRSPGAREVASTPHISPGAENVAHSPDRSPGTDHVETLPNVGREAQTYLHHIVQRYDDLADVTVFCQGKPFDHVSNFHGVLRNLNVGDFQWFGHIIDRDDRTGSLLFQKWSKNENHRPLPMDDFFRRLWNEPAPEFFTFYPGANFAVTADQVRTRPLSFYQTAIRVSESLRDAAHGFERCWDRMFGVNGIPPEYRRRVLPIYLKPIRRLVHDD